MFSILKTYILKRKSTAVITFTVLPLVLAGSFLVNHFFFNTAQEAEAWYSDNWLYRQGIPIQNSGDAREDYQVAITVDTSTPIGAGKMQAMCQDIRFTSKITGKELPYWIESGCDSATTKIWVNVDKLPYSASSTYATVDMYYGNPTAPKGENGDETFLFFDDFSNDLSKWDKVFRDKNIAYNKTTSTIAIQSDATVRLAPSPNHQASADIISNKTFTNGISVEARRKQDSDDKYMDFSLGYGDIVGDGDTTNYWHTCFVTGYSWFVQNQAGGEGYIKLENSGATTLFTLADNTIPDTSNYQRYQYIYDTSGELWWLMDDTYVGSSTNTTHLANSKQLLINQGEHPTAGDNQNIDWVFVRKYDEQSTEPAMGTAQSEEQGKGAVGYWSFDEGYGSTAYDSAQSNHGTITGATWKNEDECISGKCLFFDGTGDYVQVPNAVASSTLNFGTDSFTISWWQKTSDSTASRRLFWKRDGSAIGYDILMSGNANGNMQMFIGDQESFLYNLDLADNALSDSDWHHVVAVYDRTNAQNYLYIDGVRQKNNLNTAIITDSINNTADLFIGSNSSSGDVFNGHLDEIKFYSYARTAAEVKADYLTGLKGGTASIGKSDGQGLNDGLIAHYKMDEASWSGAANEVVDSSGAGNHGVRAGDATTTSTAKYGLAGDFDSDGDYVTVFADAVLDTSLAHTYSLWALAEAWDSDTALFGDTSGTLLYNQSASICAYNTNTNKVCITASTDVWHHYVLIDDDEKIYFYFDGVLQGTADSSTTDGIDFYIGTYQARDVSSFNGQIDDVRVYNRAISKREALQLYETGPPPVLHLKMDENTGTTAYDTSENSNDGAFGGSPEWKGAEECRYGGCLDFDGASDYLQVSDHNTLDIKGAITLSAWVKPDSFNHSGGGNNPRILDKGNFVLYSYNATGNITAYTFGLSDIEIISDTAIPLDQWSYVVATYDQSTGNKIVYINGIEDKKETSVTGEININVADLYIGDRSAGDRNWDGKIDDVRVYNYARTPKQIAEDMMAGAPATSNRVEASDGDGPASGPVLYYKFDDLHMATTSDYSNVRAIVKDQSGRGNHGEVYNATSTPGKFGNALGFDGALDYVDLPTFSSTAQTYTFSMWVKSPIADGTTDYLFDTATGRFLLAFFGTTSGQIGFYDGAMKNFGDAPNDGEWHHLVWLFDSSASTGKLYIDGSQFGNTQSYTAMNISGNVKIGSHNDPPIGSWYTGKIDEFKIYEYLLDEDEIKVEYNRGKALMVAPPENPTVTASGAHPGGSAPIMHLTFDEKIGTTSTDRTGNGNDGGIVDGTWKGSGYCKKGGCLEFDGSDDYVRVVDTNILDFGTGDFSVSWWAKLIDIDASNFMISKYPPNATEGAFDFGTTATGDDIDFLVRDNTTGGTYSRVTSSGVSITDNKWHHFVATRNDQELNAYVDGVLAGTHSGLASGSDVSNSSNLLIGARQSSLFQGNIDDVKIWDRALTVAEVAYEYNKGEPVGHWKFDEGDGDWAYDASGNDNHGYVVIGEGGTNVATSTAWQNGATGKINGSLDFDKTDDCMELKNSSLLSPGTGEITLSAWIKTSDDFSSTAGAIYSDYGSVTNNLVSVYIQTDNKIEITFRDSAGHKLEIKNEGPVVNDGLWHHVVSVRTSQTTASYYLDGELIATDTDGNVATITVSDGTVPTIGSYTSTLLFFGGQIDDVRIYNYARNPSQIKQDYNYGKSLYFK